MATEIPLVPAPAYPPVSLATRLAGEDLDCEIIRAAALGNATRVENTTAEQILKPSRGYVLAVLLETAPSAASTITIKNATQTLHTINVPANAGWTRYELGFYCDTDIRVQANNSGLVFTVIYA